MSLNFVMSTTSVMNLKNKVHNIGGLGNWITIKWPLPWLLSWLLSLTMILIIWKPIHIREDISLIFFFLCLLALKSLSFVLEISWAQLSTNQAANNEFSHNSLRVYWRCNNNRCCSKTFKKNLHSPWYFEMNSFQKVNMYIEKWHKTFKIQACLFSNFWVCNCFTMTLTDLGTVSVTHQTYSFSHS